MVEKSLEKGNYIEKRELYGKKYYYLVNLNIKKKIKGCSVFKSNRHHNIIVLSSGRWFQGHLRECF